MFLIKFFAHFQLDYDVDDEREGGGAQLLRQLLRWHVFMGTREIIIWNLHYPSYAISSVSSANFDLKSLCMWPLLSTRKLFSSKGFFCPCNMKIRARVCVYLFILSLFTSWSEVLGASTFKLFVLAIKLKIWVKRLPALWCVFLLWPSKLACVSHVKASQFKQVWVFRLWSALAYLPGSFTSV